MAGKANSTGPAAPVADSDARRGVVFDCDGVLIDSMDAWHDAEKALADRAGVVLTEEQTQVIASLTIPEVGVYFHDNFALGESPQEVVDAIDAAMTDFYAHRSRARPGALEFMKSLCEQGVRCSVASTTPSAYLNAGLAHTGFAEYLDAIVSVDDVGISKREPAVYDRACQLMGVLPEHAWVIEDSLYALETLRKAGYRTVGLFDRDISGTFDQLKEAATIAVRSYEELDAQAFAQ